MAKIQLKRKSRQFVNGAIRLAKGGFADFNTPNDTIRDTNQLIHFRNAQGQIPDYVVHNQTIHNQQKPEEKSWFRKTLDATDNVLSAPQRAVTYAITGKYQDPSQALGIDEHKHPWLAAGTNLVLDPLNALPFVPLLKGLKGAETAVKTAETIGKIDKPIEVAQDLGKGKEVFDYGKYADFAKEFRKGINVKDIDFAKYSKYKDFQDIKPLFNTKDLVMTPSLFEKLSKTGAGIAIINDLIKQTGNYEQTITDNYTTHFPDLVKPQAKPLIKTKKAIPQTFAGYTPKESKKIIRTEPEQKKDLYIHKDMQGNVISEEEFKKRFPSPQIKPTGFKADTSKYNLVTIRGNADLSNRQPQQNAYGGSIKLKR